MSASVFIVAIHASFDPAFFRILLMILSVHCTMLILCIILQACYGMNFHKNFPENCRACYVRSQSVPIFLPLSFSVSFSPLPVPLKSFTLQLKSFAFWKQAAKGESNLGSAAIPITVCFEFVSSQLLKHSCWP